MDNTIRQLYDVILSRRGSGEEGSYTGYLFREGIDKILKKVGEESSEVIISAKSLEAAADSASKAKAEDDLSNEICDLLYHLLVLLAERGIPLENIDAILSERANKTSNLKQFKQTDKNS
jgi:phosphoribosyl-ATP pyrophosphohydrolase